MDWLAGPPPLWAIWGVVILNLLSAGLNGTVAVFGRRARWFLSSVAVLNALVVIFNLLVLWSRGFA